MRTLIPSLYRPLAGFSLLVLGLSPIANSDSDVSVFDAKMIRAASACYAVLLKSTTFGRSVAIDSSTGVIVIGGKYQFEKDRGLKPAEPVDGVFVFSAERGNGVNYEIRFVTLRNRQEERALATHTTAQGRVLNLKEFTAVSGRGSFEMKSPGLTGGSRLFLLDVQKPTQFLVESVDPVKFNRMQLSKKESERHKYAESDLKFRFGSPLSVSVEPQSNVPTYQNLFLHHKDVTKVVTVKGETPHQIVINDLKEKIQSLTKGAPLPSACNSRSLPELRSLNLDSSPSSAARSPTVRQAE